ncbi:ATP-binding protein [Saccharicrinis fermentans]|uniref:histidine kinase n=1 Tax=Saccharicrinis fermentans DSM 9555 = JCM 21142 TaxID=869213 RepID=W7Y8I7_9BACT|nr:transporter substrate-binding domain-containing protein [Saccharicrinis fermentans]GAF04003.1 signal transduction histidine-protein kinase BarA [Saccharicrinis fermentans DSM 9555 = JCM 21142]
MRNPVVIILLIVLFTANRLDGQYKIAFSNNYPPYQFMDESGELVGFNVDILKAINDVYKANLYIIGGEWHAIKQDLDKGEVNAVGGIHYPGSPDSRYIYTRSVINTSHCFFYNSNYHKKFSLEVFRSLHAPKVAMWKNDVLSHYITSINPTVDILYINNYGGLIPALDSEEVTCVFAQRVGGMYQVKKLGKNYIKTLDQRILERNMGFRVDKDVPELAQLLDHGLEILLANGTYQDIYDKWIGVYEQKEKHWYYSGRNIVLAGSIILVLILLLLIINQVLNAKVKSKTKDLLLQLELNSNMMKELERQKVRAEDSEKMKTAFLANMSHEIRTPMNGILGFTELLKTVEYSSEEQMNFIKIIEQSGNRMLGTINNIIDVSKLESGLEEPSYQEVDIRGILIQLRSFFKQETNLKGIALKIIEEGVMASESFVTDEYKLNSILTNLIKNGIKFTKEGFVSVTYSVSSDLAQFWIEDTGIGIAESRQSDIFDQFVQEDTSYSRNFEGSGLGLSISRGYVNLLGGKITLKSEPQKGTVFYFCIPNHKPPFDA